MRNLIQELKENKELQDTIKELEEKENLRGF